MTIVVNLFGGPGTGKSTMMADIFANLKWAGINCEMAPEFAKEKVWEESLRILDNQIYVFGKQHNTIQRLIGKVDVIITDSPLLLSVYYGKKLGQTFRALVFEEHEKLTNLNILLRRKKKFNLIGRLQNEEQAKMIDDKLEQILCDDILTEFDANSKSTKQIVLLIKDQLSVTGLQK